MFGLLSYTILRIALYKASYIPTKTDLKCPSPLNFTKSIPYTLETESHVFIYHECILKKHNIWFNKCSTFCILGAFYIHECKTIIHWFLFASYPDANMSRILWPRTSWTFIKNKKKDTIGYPTTTVFDGHENILAFCSGNTPHSKSTIFY